jgi:7-cyano-7-deazaguanine synthase in queuosine biosynthesis
VTVQPVTWVLGDHATHPDAPNDALRFTIGGKADSMSLCIDGLEDAMSGRLPPRFLDLIRIATFAFAADSAVSRGRLEDDGDRWHRHFRIVLGVEDPDFWNRPEVRNPIEQTLGFISQDTFQFHFQTRQQKPPKQLTFAGPAGKPLVPWEKIQDVALFSGGLDSFTGAADLIIRQRRGVAFVSHQSSTKIGAVQNELFQDLRQLAKDHGCPEPVHVVVNVQKHAKFLSTERTQRSRSFLYASIAGAVAQLLDRDRITAPESGIIGVNLPVARSVVGARGTRTAHPRALVGFGKILSAIADRTITVANPFALKTRAEVLQALAKTPAIHFAKNTNSCARVHRSSKMHPHCGTCSQCIDRQFGFLASGLEGHDSELGYEERLTHDTWEDPTDRDLLLNWIRAASGYAAFKNADEFVASNGDAMRAVPFIMASEGLDPDGAQHAVFDLHRRHGRQVLDVLDQLGRSAQRRPSGTLASMLPQGQVEPVAPDLERRAATFGIENRLTFGEQGWKVMFRNGPVSMLPDTVGIQYLGHLLSNPGRVFDGSSLRDLVMGRTPSPRTALDQRGREAVKRNIAALEAIRTTAQEMGDDSDAARCQAEIDILHELIRTSTSLSTKQKVVSAGVETEIRSCIKSLESVCPPLAKHLREHVHVGAVMYYRGAAQWIVKHRPTAVDAPDEEWVPAKTLVNEDLHAIRTAKDLGRFCKKQTVPTRPAKTKDGREHKQRLEVHKPSFDAAMREFRRTTRSLADFADRQLTEDERRAEQK